jgi:tungstate transport system substrate-binding protein
MFGIGANRRGRDLARMLLVLMGVTTPACQSTPNVVRMATTTSVENSGLLAAILPAHERRAHVRVEVLAVGSGQALNLLKRGEVTVGLTHDPAAEASALAAGTITHYRKIMFNDFIIVGPPGDPAGVARASDVLNAFERIATQGVLFMSRGDGSGTFSREQELWALAKRRPRQDALLETGQGMGGTLRVAGERAAYTLTDRATFEQFRSGLRLASLYQGGPELLNTYAIFVRAASTGAEREAAMALTDWFADTQGRQLVASFVANGHAVFNVWPAGSSRSRSTDRPPLELANAR